MKKTAAASRLEGDYYDYWDRVGRIQFEFLKGEGLKPPDHLLDVACGSFRGGRFFIDYLLEGHYFGIDRNVRYIESGIERVLKPSGLLTKSPRVHVVALSAKPVDLAGILGFSCFDYVWIHSLFDHISSEIVSGCLRDVARVTAEGGRIYATIFLNPHGPDFLEPLLHLRDGKQDRPVTTYPDKEHWHHTIDFFEETARRIHGLCLDACLDHYPHPLGLKVLRFIHRP